MNATRSLPRGSLLRSCLRQSIRRLPRRTFDGTGLFFYPFRRPDCIKESKILYRKFCWAVERMVSFQQPRQRRSTAASAAAQPFNIIVKLLRTYKQLTCPVIVQRSGTGRVAGTKSWSSFWKGFSFWCVKKRESILSMYRSPRSAHVK